MPSTYARQPQCQPLTEDCAGFASLLYKILISHPVFGAVKVSWFALLICLSVSVY